MRLQGKLHFFSQVIIGDNPVKYPSVAGAPPPPALLCIFVQFMDVVLEHVIISGL